MILPLINSEGQFCFLDTQEIIYIQTNGVGNIYIHSFDEKYRAMSMMRDWSLLLRNSDFMQMDRGTIVNTRNIVSYDPILNVVGILASNGEVSIPVSHKMISTVRKHLNKI